MEKSILLSVLVGSPKSPDFLMAKFELLGEKHFKEDQSLSMFAGTVKEKSQDSLY